MTTSVALTALHHEMLQETVLVHIQPIKISRIFWENLWDNEGKSRTKAEDLRLKDHPFKQR